ncbi:MAG TPA: creatininase family protein [Candidatus Deferrimicrobium sp.]|nr:creatininase family protein [Candidatus Kapabacteria bacterium]HLP62662.1 creatininase family protein [Candidatus Deferrimicrobium sp.]
MKIEELTTTDIREYLETQNAVLIPIGSIEQHGAHLPLGTDTLLVNFIVDQVSDLTHIPMLPVISYGPCFNSSSHEGTISISTRLLYDLVHGIVSALYAQGFRKFFLFSGHADESQLFTLREVGEDFMKSREDAFFHVLCTYHVNVNVAEEWLDTTQDFHAGAVETSLMLYLRPDLVNNSRLTAGSNEIPEYEIVRDKKKYWASGVDGNPAGASEDIGRHIFEKTVVQIRKYVSLKTK